MKHFATTFQAVNTADLGKAGCALPQQRTSGQLPKEAKEFLQVLFERGEVDSSEKVSGHEILAAKN